MKNKFNAKKLMRQVVHNGESKFFLTEANEIYMSYGPHPQKGAFLMLATNLDPIIISAAKMPLSSAQKEAVRQLIIDEGHKLALAQQVSTRIGAKGDNLYVDLGNNGTAKVTAKGVTIQKESPVPYFKSKTLSSLPEPDLSADIPIRHGLKLLKKLINVTNAQFMLVVAWLMSLFLLKGEKPILILEGGQGSAKTTTMKNLTKILDPHQPPHVSLSTREKDIFITAHNRALVGFDNVSDIRANVSDWLCQISSGGATASRKLYTDGEEFIIYAHSSIILNGITTNAVRGDLLDRAIKIETPVLGPEARQTGTELDAKFQEHHPIILGALLRMAQYGLKNPRTLPDELKGSRLADFCQWTYSWAPAAEVSPEALLEKIVENQRRAKLEVLSEDTVTAIMLELLEDNDDNWAGSSTRLFEEFRRVAQGRMIKLSNLPDSPRALTAWLVRSEPSLAASGIEISRKHSNRGTLYTISRNR